MSQTTQEHELNKPVPYKLHISDTLLSLTKKKLELARYPEELENVGDDDWSQGAKVKEVQRLANYWKDDYDWGAEEVKINSEFEQFTVEVNVLGYGPQVLHFAHHISSHPNAIPLMFVQGWPGSFLEARKIVQPLTNPPSKKEQAFHVIVPSIPGFGPGPPPTKSGFGPVHTAKAFKQLMVDVLGYDKFVTQGGDWGAMITRSLAMQYPQHVRACHLNMFPCGPPPWYKAPLTMGRLILSPWLYTKREMNALESVQYYLREQSGYLKTQSTRPQSLAFGLGDSPIGLLGWLVEKFHEWMDVENYKMPDEEIITFVMMHWMQGAIPGLRYYKAAYAEEGPTNAKNSFVNYCATPVGVSGFPKEIFSPPIDWMRAVANVQWFKEHDKGGHFAAVECPEALVEDLRDWFGGSVVKKSMEA